MFKEEIIEMYYSENNTSKLPIAIVCECFAALERVLNEIRKENPYATISDLFDE